MLTSLLQCLRKRARQYLVFQLCCLPTAADKLAPARAASLARLSSLLNVGAKTSAATLAAGRSNNSTSSVGAAADADSKVSTRSHAASSSSSRSFCGSASRRRSHDDSRGTSSPAHGSASTGIEQEPAAPKLDDLCTGTPC